MDNTKITNVILEDVNLTDLPDLVDAFIVSADYDGEPMTEEQLTQINFDYDFVHDAAYNSLF
jgi:hypothetical protein